MTDYPELHSRTYPRPSVAAGHVEAVPRRIRARLGGRVVLDTTRALYLWEWPFYPQFLIPVDDVDAGALVDEGRSEEPPAHGTSTDTDTDTVARVGLRAGGEERPGAGRRYVASEIDGLVDRIRFDWDALDAWFEEDEQVFVHPRNPYVRVDALRSRRRVRVSLEGVVLAESDAAVMVFETGLPTRHYVDRADVRFEHLRPSDTVTVCPYKGTSSFTWSVATPSGIHEDLAWSYTYPTRQLLPIAGLVAFYDERVDVELDGVAQPRPTTHFFPDT